MNRVLIIEDDPVARRQLAQMFRFEDYIVKPSRGRAVSPQRRVNRPI